MSSNYANLRITRAGEATAINPAWLRLEQVKPPETQKRPGISDLYTALTAVMAGLSARQMRPDGAPVEFDGTIVRFFLGFFVWPSSPRMRYQLHTNIGEISHARQVNPQRTFHLFADNIVGVSTPYYLDGTAAHWETPCSDRVGQQITTPVIDHHHTHFLFGREVFAGIKISGTALGYYHVLTVEIDKATPEGQDVKITDLEPVITASWYLDNQSGNYGGELDPTQPLTGENTSSEQLRLELPDTVADILAACPNDPEFGEKWCQKKTDTIGYFSTCTGDMLEVRSGQNPRKYCTKVSLSNYLGWERGQLDGV